MRRSSLSLGRRAVGLALTGLIVGLLGLVGLMQVAQFTGRSVFVIHGSSMSPAIPLGAAALAEPVPASTLEAGDVVTIRADSGLIYTHRIVAVVSQGSELAFQTRGDANPTPDPQPAPASAIVGRTVLVVPMAGYLIALLGLPSGILSVLSLLGALLLLFWLLEDLEFDTTLVPALAGLGPGAEPVAAATSVPHVDTAREGVTA